MNIFVTDRCPIQSARNLPDKHIVKMPLETCQMLSIIYSDWYYGVGKLYKSDGTPYRTAHGAFASIRAHSGLPPTSTTLHGSYVTATHYVTSTIYVTTRYIPVSTLLHRQSVSTTSRSTISCFHTHHARSQTLHVPCQSTSSSTLLSTLSQRTNATSIPSRG